MFARTADGKGCCDVCGVYFTPGALCVNLCGMCSREQPGRVVAAKDEEAIFSARSLGVIEQANGTACRLDRNTGRMLIRRGWAREVDRVGAHGTGVRAVRYRLTDAGRAALAAAGKGL